MAGQQGDRTEQPTARRLKDARERGQVARSQNLAGALSLAGATLVLGWFGVRMWGSMSDRIAAGLSTFATGAAGNLDAPTLAALMWSDAALFARVAGPPAVVAALASVATSVAQVGWNPASKALRIDWNRLNPATGFQRFAPIQAGAELVKALIGLAAVGTLCYLFVREFYEQAPRLVSMTPAESASFGWDRVWTLVWRSSIALAILAIGDYLFQRWRWYSQLKMTRQEVRDEAKSNDGNPEVKARVRRVQREMTKRRMLHAVKTATVVITNPTHFAVALEYKREGMTAPVVVAKGQDELAQRIKALAREHNVPMVENVTLARALYKSAEVGDAIPASLFGAVAEVLAYLVRLKQLVL